MNEDFELINRLRQVPTGPGLRADAAADITAHVGGVQRRRVRLAVAGTAVAVIAAIVLIVGNVHQFNAQPPTPAAPTVTTTAVITGSTAPTPSPSTPASPGTRSTAAAPGGTANSRSADAPPPTTTRRAPNTSTSTVITTRSVANPAGTAGQPVGTGPTAAPPTTATPARLSTGASSSTSATADTATADPSAPTTAAATAGPVNASTYYFPGIPDRPGGEGYLFQSPSGNIKCDISTHEPATGCLITTVDRETAGRPADCPAAAWHHSVHLGPGGTSAGCDTAADAVTGQQQPTYRPLQYGQSITAEGTTCSSTEAAGISCSNIYGQFVISRSGITRDGGTGRAATATDTLEEWTPDGKQPAARLKIVTAGTATCGKGPGPRADVRACTSTDAPQDIQGACFASADDSAVLCSNSGSSTSNTLYRFRVLHDSVGLTTYPGAEVQQINAPLFVQLQNFSRCWAVAGSVGEQGQQQFTCDNGMSFQWLPNRSNNAWTIQATTAGGGSTVTGIAEAAW